MTASKNFKKGLGETVLLREQDVQHQWYRIDAEGKTLGRLCSEIAKVLRGKHKPNFTPHVDCGDGVIIVNAEKVVVTGDKEVQKIYRYYTGSMSGMRETPLDVIRARKPGYMITHAVSGMMPKGRLGRKQLKRLRVFAGDQHHHGAQKPIQVNV